MIQANKADLIYSVHKSSTDLQAMEISMLGDGIKRILTVTGVILGFVGFGMMSTTKDEASNHPLEIFRAVCSSVSLGCLIMSLGIGLILLIWGPGLALQGSRGTEDIFDAVTQMDQGLRIIFTTTGIGILFMIVSSLFTILLEYPFFPSGIIVVSILFGFCIRILSAAKSAFLNLYIYNSTSAILKGDPILPGYNRNSRP